MEGSLLITGGSGSFGHAFVHHMLALPDCPERLCILSRDELKQAEMRAYFQNDPRLRWFIGDVRDVDRLLLAFRGVETVIHAAAMKRIDSCGQDPLEAKRTNIDGTCNMIRAALDTPSVKRVIALSSDKASAPLNFYGKTKACLEDLCLDSNQYAGARGPLFSVVRYGNVAGSRGSVIPKWRKAIADGHPLPMVNPHATRFWFTLDGAVSMVRKVLEEMQGGELYVPLLPSFRVGDLASAMVPVGTDPRVDYINGHPGEKPHECMVSRDEAHLFRRLPDGFVHYINGRACGEALPTDFQYSSDTNTEWLDVDELRRRLRDIR